MPSRTSNLTSGAEFQSVRSSTVENLYMVRVKRNVWNAIEDTLGSPEIMLDGMVRICKNSDPPVDYQGFRHVNDKTNVVVPHARKCKSQASDHANDFYGKADADRQTNVAILMEQSKNWWGVKNN